jgi:hypothetical protein
MKKTMLAGTVLTAVLAAAGCGAGQSGHSAAARQGTGENSTAGQALAVKGHLARLPDCKPHDVAAVAVVRLGISPAALGRAGIKPAARLTSSSDGRVLAFFQPHASLSAGNAVFSTGPEMVPADPSLQSCDYLLKDRPAAQPYVTAAIDAAAASGIASSPGSLRSKVDTVLLGDNPLQSGSVVVILLVEGPLVARGPNGQKGYGPDSSVFVTLDRSTMHSTGVAAGTW